MPNLSGTGKSGVSWTMTGGNVSKSGGITRKNWRLSGIDEVSQGINAQLNAMRLKSAAGLVNAARIVLNDADSRSSPLVPEDEGPLRASKFVNSRKKPSNNDPYVELGYNSNYAAAVHEMMESPSGEPINWSRPESGPKFLEKSLARNAKLIIETVRNSI